MSKNLTKVLENLMEGNEDKAKELLHNYFIKEARKINEEMSDEFVEEDDFDFESLDENDDEDWDEDGDSEDGPPSGYKDDDELFNLITNEDPNADYADYLEAIDGYAEHGRSEEDMAEAMNDWIKENTKSDVQVVDCILHDDGCYWSVNSSQLDEDNDNEDEDDDSDESTDDLEAEIEELRKEFDELESRLNDMDAEGESEDDDMDDEVDLDDDSEELDPEETVVANVSQEYTDFVEENGALDEDEAKEKIRDMVEAHAAEMELENVDSDTLVKYVVDVLTNDGEMELSEIGELTEGEAMDRLKDVTVPEVKIGKGSKSPVMQRGVNDRTGAKGVQIKQSQHTGHEREAGPKVEKMKDRVNNTRGTKDLKQVGDVQGSLLKKDKMTESRRPKNRK